MGERILRPGIRTSDKLAALIQDKAGGWFAAHMYTLLITVVDDYGRYDARPQILRSELFPLLLDTVREANVQRAIEALERARLIRRYESEQKPYLEITKWKQRLRAKKSRFPAPAGQCHDNVVTMPTDTETETETHTETEKKEGRSGSSTAQELPVDLMSTKLATEWAAFVQQQENAGRPVDTIRAAACFAQFREWGVDDAVQSLRTAIIGNHAGLIRPPGKKPSTNGSHKPLEKARIR